MTRWPYERRTTYDAWPNGVKEYYWTLDEPQANGFWMLTDPQRVSIYEMTPAQRATAWQQINAQMNGMNNASDTGMTARTNSATTTQPRFVRSEVTQTTPAGYKSAANGEELPICSADQEDRLHQCLGSRQARSGCEPSARILARTSGQRDRRTASGHPPGERRRLIFH